MKADSLIFDLDGTLWDASDACMKAWNKTLEVFGGFLFRVSREMVARFSGRLLQEILAQELPFIPADQYRGFISLYARHEAALMQKYGGSLYPGVLENLNRLAEKYRLFIVSNCQQGYIENFLRFHQLENYFSDFECSGNTGLAKKENLQLIIDRNKLASPVYIGDTSGDEEASRWNQIPFIYAAYGLGVVPDPEHRIDQFTDLLQWLEISEEAGQ